MESNECFLPDCFVALDLIALNEIEIQTSYFQYDNNSNARDSEKGNPRRSKRIQEKRKNQEASQEKATTERNCKSCNDRKGNKKNEETNNTLKKNKAHCKPSDALTAARALESVPEYVVRTEFKDDSMVATFMMSDGTQLADVPFENLTQRMKLLLHFFIESLLQNGGLDSVSAEIGASSENSNVSPDERIPDKKLEKLKAMEYKLKQQECYQRNLSIFERQKNGGRLETKILI